MGNHLPFKNMMRKKCLSVMKDNSKKAIGFHCEDYLAAPKKTEASPSSPLLAVECASQPSTYLKPMK